MRALLSVFRIRFMLQIQYRVAAIAGIVTQVFFGWVMVMTYEAFFKNAIGGSPMTFRDTVTYLWLGQGLLGLLPWNGDRDVQKMIRSGDFAYELVRPISIYHLWYARILAQRLAPTSLRALPLFLVVGFLVPAEYRMEGPENFLSGTYFVMTLVASILLGCAISNLITLSVLFTIGDGIERLVPAFVMVLSGMIVPIAYFPDSLQPVIKALPFCGLVDTPYRFYLGLSGDAELIPSLFHQCAWAVALFLAGQFIVSRAIRRTIIQGG